MDKVISRLFVITILSGLAGCGGPGGTDITGKITFSDSAPLTKGTVILTNEKFTYRGVVSPDGTYNVTGVASGEYKVGITGTTAGSGAAKEVDEMEYNDQTGEYSVPPKPEGSDDGGDEGPANLLAAKFSRPEESGVTIKVPGKYDFQVESP